MEDNVGNLKHTCSSSIFQS